MIFDSVETCGNRFASHELRHQKGAILLLPGVEDRDHIGVTRQPGERADFVLQPLPLPLLARLFLDPADDDATVERAVERQEDLLAAPLAQSAFRDVSAVRKARQGVAHGRLPLPAASTHRGGGGSASGPVDADGGALFDCRFVVQGGSKRPRSGSRHDIPLFDPRKARPGPDFVSPGPGGRLRRHAASVECPRRCAWRATCRTGGSML